MMINPAALDASAPRSASGHELMDQGYTILRGAVSPSLIGHVADDLGPRYAATPFCEGGFYGERTKRFGRLLIRSPHMADLVMNSAILDLAELALGNWCERIQLNLAQAIELHPGALAQFPHRDQDMWQGALGEVEYLVNVMWPLTPFWEFVGQALAYSNLRTERTGIVGLLELLPGCSLAFDGHGAAVRAIWLPWEHVAKPAASGAAELASALELRIDNSVKAWSSGRSDILLELSGGLDSSIIAASLSAAGADFSAINFATPGADGDERHFARAVAERVGAAMIEARNDDTGIDLLSPPANLHPRPGAYGVLGGLDHAFEEAGGGKAKAVIGGIGGDNVFAFDSSIGPAVDAFEQFGFSRRTFAVLRDVARAGEATIWEAVRLLVRARRAGPRRGWPREASFCNQAALPAEPFAHPWDDGAASASRGKRKHVEAIRRILDFADRPDRWYDRDVGLPLLSQPVVELCLTIPSWAWFTGGRDRAVARAAFASRLPASVVWRRDKGRLESLCTAAFLRQRHDLGALLLGGRLAARGLLDQSSISAYIEAADVVGNFDYFRLLEIADVERWVRAVETSSFFGSSNDQR